MASIQYIHLLAATIVFNLAYYIYWQFTVGAKRRALIEEYGCLPIKPLPTKDFLFGVDRFKENLVALKEHRLLELVKTRIDNHGSNTMTFPSLGRQLVQTIEPENLKTILALNFKQWSLGKRRKIAFGPFLGVGIFTSDGADWQHSRDMLRPNFVRTQLQDLNTFETHVSHLIEAIPVDGSMVDLQDLFFRLTMDSATKFLFGESTNCLLPTLNTINNSKFATSFNRAQEAIGSAGRYGFLGRFLPQKQFKEDAKYVHDFVDTYVEKGLAKRQQFGSEKREDTQRYIFIDELVRQTTDPIRIRSELLNVLLAGRDTTASLLSNVWWTLSQRPDIWAKLRAEVDTLNGDQPTFEQLKDLKYLKAILNESLRLYPVVPSNSREAAVDTVLPLGGGPDGKSPALVKKGQVVIYNVYAMHRRKDFYGEDAEDFKPERWIGPNSLRPGWEYLPFNGGPRICLGQQFALTEASYTTVRLVQSFSNIESRDPEPWHEWITLTCVGRGGCKVVLTK